MKIRSLLISAMTGAISLLTVGTSASANEWNLGTLSDSQKAQADTVLSDFCSEISSATHYSADKNELADNPYGYHVEEGLKVELVSYYDNNKSTPNVQPAMQMPSAASCYVYMIPYSNEDCCGVYTLSEGGDGLRFSSQTMEKEISNPLFQYQEQIQNCIAQNFDSKDLVSVGYCLDSALYIYTVEIKTDSESYVIPYFAGIGKTLYSGIKEGTIYKSEDFRHWTCASFTASSGKNASGELLYGGPSPEYIGGIEIAEAMIDRNRNFQSWYLVAISGFALVLAGAFFAVQHRRKPALYA